MKRKQTQAAMVKYFGWLQKSMSSFPGVTQSVTTTFAFMQKLSQAKNLQEVVKIQTEFGDANEFV